MDEDRLARMLFEALRLEESEDVRKDPNRRGLGGYASADDGKTILDGAYDLQRVARIFLGAVSTAS